MDNFYAIVSDPLSWRANLSFSFQISVLPIEPEGGACQELRPRAVHEAVQLCELQDGGLGWGFPVQISVQDPPPTIRGLQALTLPNPNPPTGHSDTLLPQQSFPCLPHQLTVPRALCGDLPGPNLPLPTLLLPHHPCPDTPMHPAPYREYLQ